MSEHTYPMHVSPHTALQESTAETFAYHSPSGDLIYEVIYHTYPDEYVIRRTDRYENARRALYRLPNVTMAVSYWGCVYLVAGERAAKAISKLGVCGTTILGGPDAPWNSEYTEYLRDADVIILPDRSEAGQAFASRAAEKLRSAVASLKIVHLPGLPEGGTPEDWIAAGGTKEELLQLSDATEALPLTTSATAGAGKFRLWTIEELSQAPPHNYLIDDLLPENGLTVLYGPPGSGKTFAALDLALRTAKEHNVVYVAGESHSGYVNRTHAWSTHYSVAVPSSFRLATECVNLMREDDVVEFIDAVQPLSPSLIIIDTLARAMVGGEENSARDMGIVVHTCERIQRETGATILLVHHSGKNGGSARGSSALEGAADVMIRLSSKNDLITLSCEKAKEAAAFVPRHYRLKEVQLPQEQTSCVIVRTDGQQDYKQPAIEKYEQAILDALHKSQELASSELQKQAGVPSGSLHRALGNLLDKGYISQPKPRAPYSITPDGEAAINSIKTTDGRNQ